MGNNTQQYSPSITDVHVASNVTLYLRFNTAKRDEDRECDQFSGFDVQSGVKITKTVSGQMLLNVNLRDADYSGVGRIGKR